MEFNGADFNGSGKTVVLEEGTYEATLKSARMYKNEKYQSSDMQTQMDLIWDTGLVDTNDDGEEVPALIYQSFITWSFNERANLSKIVKALMGKEFDPKKAKINLVLDGHDNLQTLPHRSDGKVNVEVFEVNNQHLFGKQAMVSVTVNDNGYNRVESVSAPMRKAGTVRRVQSEPESTSSGAPGL